MHSNDIFVSHSGKDFTGCGHPSSPCATVRFAVVNESRAWDIINIEYYKGQPYEECKYIHPIMINKSLSFVGRNGKAIIQCILQRSLFLIIGKEVKYLQFENLVLTNAKTAIDQEFTASSLTIKRCILTRNNVAVFVNTTLCLLNVFESTFENNFYMGINTHNLSYIRASLMSSGFYSSKIAFRGFLPTKLIKVFISRCKFVGHVGYTETNETRTIGCVLGVLYSSTAEVVEIKIYESLFANFRLKKSNQTYGIYIYLWRNFSHYRRKTKITFDRLTFENNKFHGSAVFLMDSAQCLSSPHYKSQTLFFIIIQTLS